MENELEELVKNSDYILPGIVLFILAFWLTFTLLGFSFFKIATGLSNFLFDRYILLTYTLSPQEKATLEYKISFYRNLSISNKRKFACNVKYFISKKVFEGRDGCRVTEDMKLLIAAAATQIAFGHFPTIYEHFRHIVVYPDKYFSGSTQRYHLGEVQANGVIKLSWKAFTEGAAVQNDGIHVGYHEMAHALKIEDATLHDMEHCFMNRTALHNFHRYANERIKNFKGVSFMRDYAFSNSEEFFAVSIEYFFETPAQLRKNEPEVYNYLKLILNLDPMIHQNPVVA
ncbi:zinc-dependent peptidase [Cytophaga aurantiaca]|uniref:zinc-dependent peptidase n=1 Tax=Cytophaga aurantiaca TaxID=29530 RepID=UPI00036AE77F|nr:zinc-dependent peptidase [Cytophaga aurantiaca]